MPRLPLPLAAYWTTKQKEHLTNENPTTNISRLINIIIMAWPPSSHHDCPWLDIPLNIHNLLPCMSCSLLASYWVLLKTFCSYWLLQVSMPLWSWRMVWLTVMRKWPRVWKNWWERRSAPLLSLSLLWYVIDNNMGLSWLWCILSTSLISVMVYFPLRVGFICTS